MSHQSHQLFLGGIQFSCFELIVRDVTANSLAGYHVAQDNGFALYYNKGSATYIKQNNTQKSIFIFIVKLPLPLFTTVRDKGGCVDAEDDEHPETNDGDSS